MPRIRKKTSKRSTTHERRKLTNKVRESKKKARKEAKKSTQWKSKHKKDPGIPSTFPYKDQLLGEVAEQRRLAEEAKEKRKEAKRASKTDTSAEDEDSAEVDKNLESVASLAAKHLTTANAISSRPKKAQASEEESDEEDVPMLVNPELPDLQSVLECADVILNVLDARDPLPCRSQFIEDWVRGQTGKRIVFVLNKIDTCPREAVSSWATSLRAVHETFIFRSASAFIPDATLTPKAKGKFTSQQTSDAIGRDSVFSYLKKCAKESRGDKPFTVAVIGPTNSGKSALINSLLQRSTLPVYDATSSTSSPSTTMQAHEATLEVETSSVRIIDTPGLMWKRGEAEVDAGSRARDILLRNKGRIDRLKDPLPVGMYSLDLRTLQQILDRSAQEDLMLFYNLPAFQKGNITSFLSGVARSKQLVMKHGVLDLTGASRIVLHDWNVGRFPRYTLPPATKDHTPPTGAAELYASDNGILSTLRTRKEMRKDTGVVKMTPCEIEAREAVMDQPWLNVGEDEGDSDDDEVEAEDGAMDVDAESDAGEPSESDEGGDEDLEDQEGSDGHEAEDNADEDGEPEDEPQLRSAMVSNTKRKRTKDTPQSQSSKRVVFAAGVKSKASQPQPRGPSKRSPKKITRKRR